MLKKRKKKEKVIKGISELCRSDTRHGKTSLFQSVMQANSTLEQSDQRYIKLRKTKSLLENPLSHCDITFLGKISFLRTLLPTVLLPIFYFCDY